MTEEEARTIMKAHGWTYHIQHRRRVRTKYLFGQRRQKAKKIECYICPLSKLGELTEQELLAKLASKSPQNP